MNDLGMTPADLKAIVGDMGGTSGGFGCWFWIIILILFFFRGGIGREEERCASSLQLQNAFDTNSVMNKLNGLEQGLSSLGYAQNTTMLQGFNAQNVAMLQSANETQRAIDSCCCKTNLNILENRYADERNTCNIIQAIHEDGEKTRSLITENVIQDLRDKVTIRDAQLSQLSQTSTIESTILNSLGRYVTNPPCNFSNYNPCGCFGG